MHYPTVRILQGHDRRLRSGSPWLYSNEIQMDKSAKSLPAGSVVRLASHDGRGMATAFFNPHSLIAARILTRKTEGAIDRGFITRRVARALAIRERLFERPYYRLVHAEADGLPGVVADRFGDVIALQINSSGMAQMEEDLVAAVDAVLAPAAIVLRNDSPMRTLEGLDAEVRVVKGTLPERLLIEENGISFFVNPSGGQKTGWFFDQRDNRRFAARLAKGQGVLDLYAYTGGFALNAAAAGAESVLVIDRAVDALELAEASAAQQGLDKLCVFRKQEAFAALDDLAALKQRFGLVIADPPAFVKSKKDLPVGLKGYQKLARGCAALVAEAGYLCLSSCSHNVPEERFVEACYAGIRAAGRGGKLLHKVGASPDHPVHPALPESGYLKFLAFAID